MYKFLQMVLYHVVPSAVFSKDLQNDITVNSVEGFPIRINIYNVSTVKLYLEDFLPKAKTTFLIDLSWVTSP